jgi:hypothetical protein
MYNSKGEVILFLEFVQLKRDGIQYCLCFGMIKKKKWVLKSVFFSIVLRWAQFVPFFLLLACTGFFFFFSKKILHNLYANKKMMENSYVFLFFYQQCGKF